MSLWLLLLQIITVRSLVVSLVIVSAILQNYVVDTYWASDGLASHDAAGAGRKTPIPTSSRYYLLVLVTYLGR